MQDIEELMDSVLASVTYPCSQPPGYADEDTYLTWNETYCGSLTKASNAGTRIRHLVQIHGWSHLADSSHRAALKEAVQAVMDAGHRVIHWGPDDYEEDTGIHHIACTCEIVQVNAEEE